MIELIHLIKIKNYLICKMKKMIVIKIFKNIMQKFEYQLAKNK